MKRLPYLLLALLLTVMLIPATAFGGGGVDLYVNPAYTGGDSDGTQAKPYLKVSDALKYVTSAKLGLGETGLEINIYLAIGSYAADEYYVNRLNTTAANITLIGTNGPTHTPADSTVYTDKLQMRTSSVEKSHTLTVKNVCFVNANPDPSIRSTGLYSDITSVTVENCYFSGWYSGVGAYRGGVAEECLFEDNLNAFHLAGERAYDFSVSDCVFNASVGDNPSVFVSGDKSPSQYGGVTLGPTYTGTVENSEFDGTGMDIYSSDLTVKDCALLSGVNISTIQNVAPSPNLDGNFWGTDESGAPKTPLVIIGGDPENVVTGAELEAIAPAAGVLDHPPLVQGKLNTEVIASSDPSYIIVIPEKVDFGKLNRSMGEQEKDFKVSILDALLDTGAKVTVGVTSEFVMKLAAGDATLAYRLFNENTDALTTGATFVTFLADGEAVANEVVLDAELKADFTGKIATTPSTLTRAGSYSDTMTFVCEYVAP